MDKNEQMNKKCELTDDELDMVAGGSGDEIWVAGEWCSYESIKDQLPQKWRCWENSTQANLELACHVIGIQGYNNHISLVIQIYAHYPKQSYSSHYPDHQLSIMGGGYTTEKVCEFIPVSSAGAVRIDAPSWADECNNN